MIDASLIRPGLYQSAHTPHPTWGDALICLSGMPVAEHAVTIEYPFDDWRVPDGDKLHDVARTGATLVREGKSVVVMCEKGQNRSGLVTALILRELEGLSGAEAAQFVRTRREGSLRNPDFVAYLESLP